MTDSHPDLPPGFTVLQTLHGDPSTLLRIIWSPDGREIAALHSAGVIEIWNSEFGKVISSLKEDNINTIMAFGATPNGWRFIAELDLHDETFNLIDATTGELITVLESWHDPSSLIEINGAAFTPNGHYIVYVYVHHLDVEIDPDGEITTRWPNFYFYANDMNGEIVARRKLEISESASLMSVLPDNRRALINSEGRFCLWDFIDNTTTFPLGEKRHMFGHMTRRMHAISPDSRLLAYAEDALILLCDLETGAVRALEGHTQQITELTFLADGLYLAALGNEGEYIHWNCETIQPALIHKFSAISSHIGMAAHPVEPDTVAFAFDGEIQIVRIDLTHNQPAQRTVHYTTAKIALVGDSGVGKSGLGYRIAEDKFRHTESTHGQQFWVVDELGVTRADGTECEAVLWDFAGQPDYRLVHALFLDDVDLALLLFDPGNRAEPLRGVDFWLGQLEGGDVHKILVAARIDRAAPTLTRAELDAFCHGQGIDGGYLPTSAYTGEGIADLKARIKSTIDWDHMPSTITTVTFKRIKEYVLNLKADSDRREILVTWAALRRHIAAYYRRDFPDWRFSDAEMQTAVRHLQNHGYVTVLRGTSGDEAVLLVPELLIKLAASLVLEARRNERGLGALEEARVLRGDYPFPELDQLTRDERETLLDAVVALFIKRNICLREASGAGALLVFPSLINQRCPPTENFERVDGTTFRISGAAEHVYPALAVLLGYTNLFRHTHQWQNQAQYETPTGEICGFRQLVEREGEAELVLYYAASTSEPVRLMFENLFRMLLAGRDVRVTEYRPVICPACATMQERSTVIKRINAGRDFLICVECGERIDLGAPQVARPAAAPRIRRAALALEVAQTDQRTRYETCLTYVKGMRRDLDPKICFISYAWDSPDHQAWVAAFANDLRNAGLSVLIDQEMLQPGSSVARYMARIADSDYIVVVGTPGYLERYYNERDTNQGSGVAAEMDLIGHRLAAGNEVQKATVLPVLRTGDPASAFPPFLQPRLFADFRDPAYYFQRLFDLVLTLHGVDWADSRVVALRREIADEGARVG